jgi:RimJ/RimL family protein N-acetyltransferase
MANTFLTGKKTVLRPVALEDIRLLTKWMNDPKTRMYLLRRFPLSETDEKTYVEKMRVLSGTPSNIMMVIESKDTGQAIGTMGLHSINWIDRNAVTGTVIGEEEYRGKGYATDAKMTLLQYAFESLGLHKITSHAFAENTKSIEYSKRCGYKVEAILKEENFRNGKWEDTVSLTCFYEGWKKAKEKLEK